SMSLSTLSAIELPLAPRASGLLARQSFRAATRRGLLAKQSFRAATRRGSLAKQGFRAAARGPRVTLKPRLPLACGEPVTFSCLCAQERAAVGSPLHCGGSGRDARRGGAMDRADSAACTRMCNRRNTGRGCVLFGQEARKAQCLGCISFGYFSLCKQRKVTR